MTKKEEIEKRKAYDYTNVHQWVRYHYGNANYCTFDKNHVGRRFEWANVSGEYKRDIRDYMPLCKSCHSKYDFTEKTRQLLREKALGNKHALRRPVKQYTGGMVFIREFESMSEAARMVGASASNIHAVLNGKGRIVKGYRWRYA